MYTRRIFVSGSHRDSRYGVRDPSPNLSDALLSSNFFVMKQYQWTSKSSTEVAPHHHHLHVRADDCVLDLFHRGHVYSHRFV
jgi:hypothetical protein